MNNKTIVFVVTAIDNGGIENYLLRFIESKGSNFNDIYIYCKAGRFGQLKSQFDSFQNVKLIKHKLGYLNPIDLRIFYLFLKKVKPKSVCDFTGNFAGLTMLIAKLAGISVRISFYRNSSIRYKRNFVKNLYNFLVKKLTVRCSTELLSNSKAAIDFFYPKDRKAQKKFTVIFNGIDSKFKSNKNTIRGQLGLPESAFLVGHVGRYNEAKNHKSILRVAIDLCKTDDQIFFILCGNGVKDNLFERVKSENLTSRILLFNNYQPIIEVYNSIDCFYFPSITEGQPNALIEAMLCNIPFVASNIPSIKETVPTEYHDSLIDFDDIATAKIKISHIKNGKGYRPDGEKIQRIFNAEIQFSKFASKLID